MYKAIIIDDEEQSRIILKEEIRLNCPNIFVIAEADSVETAIESIQKNQPDLVFLDIQLANGTGFTILQRLGQIDFHVIFVTAYNQYGIQALKANATDYLLKPIDKDELVEAVQKAEELMAKEQLQLNIHKLIESSLPKTGRKKIALSTSEGIHLFEPADILRCESEGNYTSIFVRNGEKLLVAKTLKDVEQLLSSHNFERIHHSHIINIQHIKKYINKNGGAVILVDGTEIPVSQRKKSKLLSLLK